MNDKYIKWIKFIIACFVLFCFLHITDQIFPHKGITGVIFTKDIKNGCNSKITKILKDSPAEKAGLKINDCIIGVNNKNVTLKSHRYTRLKIKGKPNTTVKIKVKRNNEELDFNVQRVKNKIDWFPFL